MYNDKNIIAKQQKLLNGRQMFDVELTTNCNKQCYICPRDKLTRVGQIMPPEVFDVLCRWLPNDCDVFFAGLGEPLLHKHCIEFVQRLHNTGRKTSIMTNGKQLSRQTVHKLFAVGLDKLQISIVQKIDLHSIEHFMKLINDQYKDKVVFNIIKEPNIEEPKDELELLQKNGLSFCIKKVHNRAGMLYLTKQNDETLTCATFFCDTFISAKGDIFGCSNDINGKYCISSIDKMSFHELMEYKKRFLGNLHICNLCQQCNDEYRLKHFDKNKQYD